MSESKGLLVLKLKGAASANLIDELMSVITPTAEALGVEPMVLPAGVDVELQMGSSALLERVCVALEEIAQQGRAPEVSDAQIAPQSLNPRSRSWSPGVTCNGSVRDGTGCGQCEQCQIAMRNQGLNTRG